MKTISFKIKINDDLQQTIVADGRIQSSICRFSYNRLKEGLSKKEIYAKVNEIFPDVNCHIRSCGQGEAYQIFLSNKENEKKKVYFGKFLKFKRGLIDKEELIESRNKGIFSCGEANQKGNRLFKIDVENQSSSIREIEKSIMI